MHNKIYGSIDDKGKMWKAINQIGNGYNFMILTATLLKN